MQLPRKLIDDLKATAGGIAVPCLVAGEWPWPMGGEMGMEGSDQGRFIKGVIHIVQWGANWSYLEFPNYLIVSGKHMRMENLGEG